MATVVARPITSDEDETSELVLLNILVEDADFVGLFDQLEIWRASEESGPYEEITGRGWTPPRIPKTAGDAPTIAVTGRSVSIVDLELVLRAVESENFDRTITFTGVNPLTLAQAAAQVIAQGLGEVRAYVDAAGVFVVESTLAGVWSRLRVLGGEAAPLLGLPIEEPDSLASGHDARLALRPGKERYVFRDPFSARSFFYKTRFRSEATGALSAFSQLFSVIDQDVGVSGTNVILGQLDLIGIDGSPASDVEVTVYGSTRAVLTEGKLAMWAPITKTTDALGHVEFLLVRGISATVAVVGSSIIRDIVVPTDPEITVFNLLGAEASATDDNFKVVVPELITAERRSL